MDKSAHSAVISVGSCLPEKTVRTDDLEKQLKFKKVLRLPYGIMEKITGCREHREVDDNTNASDLAVVASQQAIERAKIATEDIDLLIFCACSQDITEPATANIIQEKIGASHAQVMDVKNACNSFVNGIDIADSMISTNKSDTALICSGEVLSRYVDLNIRTRKDLELRAAGLTLGDGGGAVIMRRSNRRDHGIKASRFISDGSQWRLAVVVAGGTMYPRAPEDPSLTYFQSDSERIIALARDCIPPVIHTVLEAAGWKPGDVDMVIPHQVTEKIIREISKAARIPFKKNIITLDRYGNTAAASIPIALNQAFETGLLQQGMKLLLVGGAAGFSVGVIALVW